MSVDQVIGTQDRILMPAVYMKDLVFKISSLNSNCHDNQDLIY